MICVDEMGDDVNRESGTTVAKRRWLQRMLAHKSLPPTFRFCIFMG